MMQTFQNALYINPVDPSNAVLYDRPWLREAVARVGLKIVAVDPPEIRGFQWRVVLAPSAHPSPEAAWPEDTATIGVRPPPLMPADAAKIGLDPEG
jgi:hypothetical protein